MCAWLTVTTRAENKGKIHQATGEGLATHGLFNNRCLLYGGV